MYKDTKKRLEYQKRWTKEHQHPCADCGKPIGKYSIWCGSCSAKRSSQPTFGKDNPHWKGGRNRTRGGYIQIWVSPGDFFYPMTTLKGQVLEHRLIMAKYLGRCLHRWEIVHHKNGIKDDNRIENLQLVTDDRHTQITILERRIKYLEKRVTLLEAENILLKYRGNDTLGELIKEKRNEQRRV